MQLVRFAEQGLGGGGEGPGLGCDGVSQAWMQKKTPFRQELSFYYKSLSSLLEKYKIKIVDN